MTNTPANVDDSVVRKIQKLFEMANRVAGNEAEAAVAMGKAQELLVKYNLDMATIQDKAVVGGPKAVDDKRGYQKVSRSAMYEWQQELVRAVAEANFCCHWIQTESAPYNKRYSWGTDTAYRKVKRHKILGRESNTIVVLMMVDYLFETLERLLPYDNKDRLSRSAISWRKGASDVLIQRITEKAAEMRKADYATQGEAAYCTALAVVNIDKAEEAANFDFRFGEGAWAKKEARNREWEANSESRMAQYRLEQAAEAAKLLAESPAAKARREMKERAEAEKMRKRWARIEAAAEREQERKNARVDHHAYRNGEQVGEAINLDSQLKAGDRASELNG